MTLPSGTTVNNSRSKQPYKDTVTLAITEYYDMQIIIPVALS